MAKSQTSRLVCLSMMLNDRGAWVFPAWPIDQWTMRMAASCGF